MLGIKLNKEVVERCVRALSALVRTQSAARARLVQETQTVCSNCEDAYSALLDRLQPVKRAYRAPKRLAKELHALAGDSTTRAKFKPEGLCSEIDQLLVDFESNLSGVKYSVNLFAITEIKDALESMGSYDQTLYHQYDGFMAGIDAVASAIDSAATQSEREALVSTARAGIAGLEADLRESIKAMRGAKGRLVRLM